MRSLVFFLSLLCLSGQAGATLTIEITQGVDGALPIAIVPFSWQGVGKPAEDLAGIIASDLLRSGRFKPLPEEQMISTPHEAKEVDYQVWRVLDVDNLVVGRMMIAPEGGYRIQFQLLDSIKGGQLAGYSFHSERHDLRRAAHEISDIIYEKLTGIRGAFDTRIAYVTVKHDAKGKQQYQLAVSDADGHNEQIIYESSQPVLSPNWSPDGKKLSYVSFARGRPEIYIQDIATPSFHRLPFYPGLNNAPAWSPDGKRLALTLSKDGNPEIYIYEVASKKFHRITKNYAIDTEPAWMPDGSALVFTSDRGGGPQLYRIFVGAFGAKGRAKRISFEGSYNARASVSADGKYVAMVHLHNGRYRIGVLELETDRFSVLTDARLDESPSFAPNGSMIIYATIHNNRGVLAAVSVDGRAQQRFRLRQGDVREPAWSPFKSAGTSN